MIACSNYGDCVVAECWAQQLPMAECTRMPECHSDVGIDPCIGSHLTVSRFDGRCIALRRYPFLLVDRVVEVEYGKYAVGYKNVTINDNFFTGHFPERPIMPGRRLT